MRFKEEGKFGKLQIGTSVCVHPSALLRAPRGFLEELSARLQITETVYTHAAVQLRDTALQFLQVSPLSPQVCTHTYTHTFIYTLTLEVFALSFHSDQ